MSRWEELTAAMREARAAHRAAKRAARTHDRLFYSAHYNTLSLAERDEIAAVNTALHLARWLTFGDYRKASEALAQAEREAREVVFDYWIK